MRARHGTVWAAGLLLLVASGCAGAQKHDTSSGSGSSGGDESSGEESGGGKSVDPEAFDQLTRLFNMKRPAVSRCYNDAVQSGKLDRKAKGRITVALAITADGKAKGVKTAQDTLKSSDVETCVVDLIKTWDLPAPGDECEFSFSYDFEPE
jgi:hypothetical protein